MQKPPKRNYCHFNVWTRVIFTYDRDMGQTTKYLRHKPVPSLSEVQGDREVEILL